MIENNLLGIKNVQESFVALLKISRELGLVKANEEGFFV